jgi:hypothetical protein
MASFALEDNERNNSMENEKDPEKFLGTYFDKTVVLRIAGVAKVFSWIAAAFYAVQWLVQAGTFLLQYARGFWAGLGFTDVAQSLLAICEPLLRGLVYFVVLQGVAQAILMFMDIEDNTRRAARLGGK